MVSRFVMLDQTAVTKLMNGGLGDLCDRLAVGEESEALEVDDGEEQAT